MDTDDSKNREEELTDIEAEISTLENIVTEATVETPVDRLERVSARLAQLLESQRKPTVALTSTSTGKRTRAQLQSSSPPTVESESSPKTVHSGICNHAISLHQHLPSLWNRL